MLTFSFLQTSRTGMGFCWLVWVALAIFGVMVALGWWASGRLPKEDETVQPHGGDAGSDSAAALNDEGHEPREHDEPIAS